MKNFFDLAGILYDDNNIPFKDISNIPSFEIYKDRYQTHTITPQEEYRPDIISWNIWDNEKLSWVLDAINGFTHGYSEYTSGTQIYYLDSNILQSIGIIA